MLALRGELLDRVVFVGGVRREFHDRDVRWASDVGKRLRDALWVFVLFVGHEDLYVGVPGIVGIAIGEEIETALASRFDHANVLRRLCPKR